MLRLIALERLVYLLGLQRARIKCGRGQLPPDAQGRVQGKQASIPAH